MIFVVGVNGGDGVMAQYTDNSPISTILLLDRSSLEVDAEDIFVF